MKLILPLLLLFPFVLHAKDGSAVNIGVNTLFLYRNSTFGKEESSIERNGLDFQEAELTFGADVDPYTKLTMILSVHPSYETNSTTNVVEQKWAVEPEEIYAGSTTIPGIGMKLGKFKAAFGKENLYHRHAAYFVDPALINKTVFGSEGLNDTGLSLSYLIPVPWFSEVTAEYIRAKGENISFKAPSPNDAVGVVHWKNFLDISEALTFEFGMSAAQGANYMRKLTSVTGADLTFKWRPAQGGKYKSWVVGSEFINRIAQQPGVTDEKVNGYNIFGQFQFAERWSAGLKQDFVNVEDSNSTVNTSALTNDNTRKTSGALTFYATEFSSYRMEYSEMKGPPQANGETIDRKVYLQANFSIGTHPAHNY